MKKSFTNYINLITSFSALSVSAVVAAAAAVSSPNTNSEQLTGLSNAQIKVNTSNQSSQPNQTFQHNIVIKAFAVIFFIWYITVVGVSLLGVVVVRRRHCSKSPRPIFKIKPASSSSPSSNSDNQNTSSYSLSSPSTSESIALDNIEGVTIIRPLKGIDTEMHACLSSSFLQQYPKFELILCADDPRDPSVPIAQALIQQYPDVDAKLLIDPADDPGASHYGPNPKINNLAKGYMQAKYDIVWVLDSNVWVPSGAMKRSVEAFNESGRGGRKIKLIHHLPLCISLDNTMTKSWGSKLDEMFLLTSHSKFYTAINAVAIAPCVMGKSNLYRRSELDAAVQRKLEKKHQQLIKKKYLNNKKEGMVKRSIHKITHSMDSNRNGGFNNEWSGSSSSASLNQFSNTNMIQGTRNESSESTLEASDSSSSSSSSSLLSDSPCQVLPGTGIRNFAQYIAEDNMIALCLWEDGDGRTHLTSDTVVQPLESVSLKGYWNRRVRWLRVRRYMVSAATYVEPTTESICSGVFGTFAFSVLFFSSSSSSLNPLKYWSWTFFLVHMILWCCIDYYHFHNLTSFLNIDNTNRPYFVSKYFSPYNGGSSTACTPRSLKTWVPAWVCREVLAFPIWLTAMCGHEIYWRNKPFRILHDLSTEEVSD